MLSKRQLCAESGNTKIMGVEIMKTWHRTSGYLLISSLLLLTSASVSFAADYTVIANKGVSSGSLSKADIQAIFLGDKTKWDDGKPVKIAVLESGSASKSFLQGVVGKTPSQFDNYWKRLIFTGKAAAPKAFDDAASLVQFVSGTSGAVGFVGDGQAGSSVKTISIK